MLQFHRCSRGPSCHVSLGQKPVSARSRMQRLLGWSHLNAKHLGLCSGFLCNTYERLSSFAGGRFTAPAIQNGKMSLSKKTRNSKRPFFEASWLVQPGQTLWNKCFVWSDWNCFSAKQSALTLSQAFCAMLQQRELAFSCPLSMPHRRTFALFWPNLLSARLCTCARNVIIPSPTRPNPPHCGHRRTTMISGIHTYYDHILFLYVIMFVCVSQTVWSGLWTWIYRRPLNCDHLADMLHARSEPCRHLHVDQMLNHAFISFWDEVTIYVAMLSPKVDFTH